MALILRQRRDEAGLTGEQLAMKAGLSKGFISQLETGSRTPSTETLGRLAEALGIGVADLFDDAADLDRLVSQELFARIEALSSDSQMKIQDYISLLELQESQRNE